MLRKNQKVVIQNKSKLKGLTGTVVFNSQNKIKVEVPGQGYLWFDEGALRKVASKAPFEGYEKNTPVKIQNTHARYVQSQLRGKAGYIHWSEGGCMTVSLKGGEYYVEAGDVEAIPQYKYLWVLENLSIARKLMMFETIRSDKIVWRDGDGYDVSDDLVFESPIKALDAFRMRNGNADIIKMRNGRK